MIWIAGGTMMLAASVIMAVGIGAVAIPAETVWGIAVDRIAPGVVPVIWSPGQEAIVWEIRVPRVLLGAIVGAGLAVAGAVLQAATRNPLADPHLLGVSSGAAFGAVLAMMHVGLILGLATLPLFAFLGALAATALVVGVARSGDFLSPGRLILSGVAVSFVVMALANLLIFLGDHRASHTVVFWMLGGLGLAQWPHLIYPATALAVALAWFMVNARQINALMAGEETAATLGVDVVRFRRALFIMSALLTSVLVAFSGMIGFVGLMIPHLVRLAVGGDSRRLLPLTALAGAVFLLWIDVFARSIMAPEDLPIGIVTGVVGGAFFIWMMHRRAG